MAHHSQSRVLLGNLDPIMRVGLRRILAEGGIEVIGETNTAIDVVNEAGRLQPDAVLLNLDDAWGRALGERIQQVAPLTKVVLWARDETLMEVLDPSARDTRLVGVTASCGLHSELNDRGCRPRLED